MRATDLLPLWAVVQRELVSTLRRGPLFAAVGVLVLGCILLAGANWPTEGMAPELVGGYTREFFCYVSYVLAGATIFVVPGIAGSSVVSERQQNTLDLLAITYARPWHVLLAKMIASFGAYLLTACAATPVLAVVYFSVGVSKAVLIKALSVIVVSAILSAAAGICCSTFFRKSSTAIAASYVASWTLFGLPIVAGAMFLDVLDMANRNQIYWSLPIRFLPAIAVTAAHESSGPGPGVELSSIIGCSVAGLTMTGILLAAACRRVQRNWGEFDLSILPGGERSNRPGKREFKNHRIGPFRVPRRTLLSRPSTMENWLFPAVSAFSLTGGALLLYTAWTKQEQTFSHGCIAWFALEAFTLAILIPALLADLFIRDRESGASDSLRMTLLSPFQIYRDKVFYAISIVRIALMAAAAGLIPIALNIDSYRDAFITVMGVGTIVECLLIGVSIGVFASVVARRMTTALTVAYVALLMVFAGNFLVLFLVQKWSHGTLGIGSTGSTPTSAYGFSPLIAYIVSAEDLSRFRLNEVVTMWLVSMVIHVSLSFAMLFVAYPLFRRQYLRDA